MKKVGLLAAVACLFCLTDAAAVRAVDLYDVVLEIDVGTGAALMRFNNQADICGFEIDSPSGQLLYGNYLPMSAHGYSGWGTFTPMTGMTIADGNLSGSTLIPALTEIDLGNVFPPNGAQDLRFAWMDGEFNVHGDTIGPGLPDPPNVNYVPEPAAFVMLLGAVGAMFAGMLRRHRRAATFSVTAAPPPR